MRRLPLAKLHIRKVLKMVDSYGRHITYLRLSVTEQCNLRCRYCMPEGSVCRKARDHMLTEEEIIRAVKTAASLGIKKVRLTGGEPLMRKDILSICEKCAAVEGIREIGMTTNGILLPQYGAQLKAAGVQRINLSLDTLDASKYADITRGGRLSQALDGLHAALAAGFEKVKINTVLIGGFNDDEIVPLAELTKRYPLDVRFIELMPMPGQEKFSEAAFVPCRSALRKLPGAAAQSLDGGVARLYRLPGALGNIGLIGALSAPFCAECNRIRLTADGKVKPCLHSAAEFSIKGLGSAAMTAQFEAAILSKPACHGMLSPACLSQAGRNMSRIGG